MRTLIVASLVWLCTPLALAQDYPSPPPQQTSPIPGARFEIVQSPIAAKWTFRLDRYSGRVWQLVRTKQDENAWEEMPVLNLAKGQPSARPRFQLFTSGLAAKHTFLFDSESGKTWLVVVGKAKRPDGTEYEYNAWQPFAE